MFCAIFSARSTIVCSLNTLDFNVEHVIKKICGDGELIDRSIVVIRMYRFPSVYECYIHVCVHIVQDFRIDSMRNVRDLKSLGRRYNGVDSTVSRNFPYLFFTSSPPTPNKCFLSGKRSVPNGVIEDLRFDSARFFGNARKSAVLARRIPYRRSHTERT